MTHSGLGRIGVGVASSATSSTIIMSSTWASVVPAGTVPKDYPRHFDGLSARPVRVGFAPIPTKSGASRASGWILWKSGAASTRASVGREPVTAEDCGSDCGAASRTGREHLQGSSPPDVHPTRLELSVRITMLGVTGPPAIVRRRFCLPYTLVGPVESRAHERPYSIHSRVSANTYCN